MSRIVKPSCIPPPRAAGSGSECPDDKVIRTGQTRSGIPGASGISTRKQPPESALTQPTVLQKQVFQHTLSKSAAQPKKVVQASGSTRSKICAPMINTKRGPEQLVKQVCIKKEVQRTPRGEYISRYARSREVDDKGLGKQVEYSSQKIDPTHATESLGVNEVVAVTSCISQTAGGQQRHKSIKKKTVRSEGLAKKTNMNPAHINRLVKEENEDVENTLKMAPPGLASTSIGKFPLKRKLQNLRMNSESMALVEKSVIHPTPAADEVETEAPPEVIASILNAVERGASPQNAPQQIFNTLFPTVQDDRINISSAAAGPMQDIVIPTEVPKLTIDEALDIEMENALANLTQGEQEQIKDDLCGSIVSPVPPEFTFKGARIDLSEEMPPWADEDIIQASIIIGAEPSFNLSPLNPSTLDPKDYSAEMSKGLDYFLDADTVPYENKVQLRGSRLPKWFPGYMSAFPHLPEVVKINKSPSGVLQTAWKAVQPKLFPDESVLIM